jgi:hypothetical protein
LILGDSRWEQMPGQLDDTNTRKCSHVRHFAT